MLQSVHKNAETGEDNVVKPLLLAAALLVAGCSTASPIRQSQESFNAAYGVVAGNTDTIVFSSSPPYVQVTVVDKRMSEVHTRCINAYSLLGALRLEHGLPVDSHAETLRLALTNKERRFEFTKPEALARLAISYADAELEVVRQRLAPYSDAELATGFGGRGTLQSLLDGSPADRPRAYRDAAACVLIDRGFSPRIADRTGALVIYR